MNIIMHAATMLTGIVALISVGSSLLSFEAPMNRDDADSTKSKGIELMETYCFTCHSPTADLDARIAPPMFAVKDHYLRPGTTKEEFVEAIAEYVQNPQEEKSRMKGAVQIFGAMPKMGFAEEDIRAIASALYHEDITKPDWYDEHKRNEQQARRNGKQGQGGGSGVKREYGKVGRDIAMQTKAVLGKNLMTAIKEKSVSGAISFCNERAYPLTDSMAKELGASIRRVSDKPRNPANALTPLELSYLESLKRLTERNELIQPIIHREQDAVYGYYPIEVNAACLQCHGSEGSDITPETLQAIRALYPNDKATGYKENDIRGMWVVKMNR